MQLETITASLDKGYKQLQPDTFQTAAEITIERRTNEGLRNTWFWTANLGLYRNNGEELQYGIGGRQTFNAIAGANIDEFCRQLINSDNYTLTPEQAQSLDALDIVWSNPADLGLLLTKQEWQYFEINPSTSNPNALTPAQRAFAEAVYGTGDDFVENMQMLSKANIRTTRIYVLNPDYVRKHTKQGQAIARASFVDDFDDNSSFLTSSRNVDDNIGLRGVRREKVREADAQNLVSLPEARLQALLEKYVAPAVLEQAKQDIAELYQ